MNSLNHDGFVSMTEEEFYDEHTKQESDDSVSRVFVPECYDSKRELSWCGRPYIQTFIPAPLTRESVRKVWVYSANGKRLRKRK